MIRIKYQLAFLPGLITLLFLSGCNLINPKEELPVYLKIEQPEVVVDPGGRLLAEAGVKDVWVTRNEDVLGVYAVPSVIPFYPKERNSFTINGGIFKSGFSSFREPYPFWKAVTLEVDAEPLDTFVLRPRFEYFALDTFLVFAFEEKFETGSLQLSSGLAGNPLEVTINRTVNGFDGNGGLMEFTADATEMELISTSWFRLPQSGGNRIFLEVTYNNTIPFTAGLIYRNNVDIGTIGGNVFANSQGEWNTLYFDFNDDVRALPTEMEFRLFFQASGEGDIGNIILDNLRIVHFTQ
jgi:hypothetical protein